VADGGDILVSSNELSLRNSGVVASAGRDGGSVNLFNSGSAFLKNSIVNSEALNNGGNIEIRSPRVLMLDSSYLNANAIRGNGGNISVAADGFLPSIDSLISASSEFGLEGSIEINTPDTNVGSGLIILPDNIEDKSINLAERCQLRMRGNVSSFFINGKGGLPVWSSEVYLYEFIESKDEN